MLKLLILLIPTLMCSEQTGVVINVDIVESFIPRLKLPDEKVCFCPEGYNCSVPARYQRDFQMIAELNDGTRVVETTEPMIMNANGDVSRCILRQNRIRQFRGFKMRLPMIPKSIHVSVSSWGVIALDGEIVPLDNFTDTKAMDFLIPFEYGFFMSGKKRVYDNGTLYQGSLDVQYSFNCLGTFPDNFCHLKCATSKIDSNLAHCVSIVAAAEFWTCRQLDNDEKTQCWTSPQFSILYLYEHFKFIDYKYKFATLFVYFIIGRLIVFVTKRLAGCLVCKLDHV